MSSEISMEESMRQCLLFFESAVRSAAMPPELVYAEFGEHGGVAWELRQELLSGKPLLGWSDISGNHRSLIEDVIREAEAMPPEALDGTGVQALLDPSWALVREAALRYVRSKEAKG